MCKFMDGNKDLHYVVKDWNMPLKAASIVLFQATEVSQVNFDPSFCRNTSSITTFKFCKILKNNAIIDKISRVAYVQSKPYFD
jgi:hypothetical protein